jgi:hypothetical protein
VIWRFSENGIMDCRVSRRPAFPKLKLWTTMQ